MNEHQPQGFWRELRLVCLSTAIIAILLVSAFGIAHVAYNAVVWAVSL